MLASWKTDPGVTYAYRYEDTVYAAGLDEYDRPEGPATIKVELHKFAVLKETPKGFWIEAYTREGKRIHFKQCT